MRGHEEEHDFHSRREWEETKNEKETKKKIMCMYLLFRFLSHNYSFSLLLDTVSFIGNNYGYTNHTTTKHCRSDGTLLSQRKIGHTTRMGYMPVPPFVEVRTCQKESSLEELWCYDVMWCFHLLQLCGIPCHCSHRKVLCDGRQFSAVQFSSVVLYPQKIDRTHSGFDICSLTLLSGSRLYITDDSEWQQLRQE